MIGSKQLPCLTGRKTARVGFHKKAKGCEGPHQPIKKRRIDMKLERDRIDPPGAAPHEVIEYTQLHTGVKNLTAPAPVDQMQDLVDRLAHILSWPRLTRVGSATSIPGIAPHKLLLEV